MTLAYLVVFVVWTVFGIRDNVQSGYSGWIIAADLTVSALAVCGMLVFHLNHPHTGFEHFWKGALAVIVVWEIILGRIDFKYMRTHPDPQLTEAENRRAALTGFGIAVLMYCPCLYIIYKLGF